jgi:UDP-N-acetylglucosamine--N-acetylmuramyl-(pentapeptide) pyrophosphoryl-undecaprenol N-acetylglucosamine transferase
VVCHESDITPGLANKICIPVATKICCNFEETKDHLPEGKGVVTGSPIRAELFRGSRDEALEFTGFSGDKPVLLIVGGSLGAVAINEAVRRILPTLTDTFDVVHLCGKGKLDPTLHSREGYMQYEYVGAQMKHLFALADVVVSRAGANAICELLALKKPNLLIPLPAKASRGDQILNAASFEKKGYSIVLQQEQMTDASLMQAIRNLYMNREDYIAAMENSAQKDAVSLIVDILKGLTGSVV